jgi:alpha-D-ribose 1-methylphosphonate 5-triphosphate synthase subunit PhnG
MNRLRRTRILVDGDPAVSRDLCAEIESTYPVRVVSAPREVLVMNKVRESAQGTLFYLGEALLTECRVALLEATGIGLLLGAQHRRAFEMAVVDAAFSRDVPLPEQERWTALLEREEERLAELASPLRQRLDATRVDFNSMAWEEDVS